MNERQAALKRLSEIRTQVESLNLEARQIRTQYEPFTQAERQAESARIERDFEACCYYYQLGDGVMWDIDKRAVIFKTAASAQAFKERYPDFCALHHT